EPRLYNFARSETDNLFWFVEKLVAHAGLEEGPFVKGFAAGRAVTVRSAELAMQIAVQPVAAEVATLRTSFDSLGKEVRGVRAAIDRFPSVLNVIKRALRKPPA